MHKEPSFIEEFMNGNIEFNDVHNYIEDWHESKDIHIPLNAYLGLSEKQFEKFLIHPIKLERELNNERSNRHNKIWSKL